MKKVNLLPSPRRQAKRLRAALRRCVGACSAYAVLLAAACVAGRAAWDHADPAVAGRLEELAAQIHQAERDIGTARAELTTVNSLLQSTRTVADQPDWGLLLALMADKTGED